MHHASYIMHLASGIWYDIQTYVKTFETITYDVRTYKVMAYDVMTYDVVTYDIIFHYIYVLTYDAMI